MEKTRQNVTLVVEEDLLLAARKVALDQRTSVNQLVREYLASLVEEPSRRRLAQLPQSLPAGDFFGPAWRGDSG